MPEGSLRVLLVDNDRAVLEALSDMLRLRGHDVRCAATGAEALEIVRTDGREGHDDASAGVQVALIDLSLAGSSGLDLLRDLSRKAPRVASVIMTGYGTVESAIDALRLGACDYVRKPFVEGELTQALGRASRHHALLCEHDAMRRRLEPRGGHAGAGASRLAGLVGEDERMGKVLEMVHAVAPSRTTVLMTGESGTGKSLIARAIHDQGPRREKPFVEISCGSIPETLLESELFGHVKGAFTGAHADKVGRFLAANQGTIFLDEINSASAAMQLKLLRVLQERRFEPVGSSQTVEVDVRVILATNQPLEPLVHSGVFRQDLYYRVNVVNIQLPPLRERPADVELLANRFLERFAHDLSRQLVGFTPDALAALRRYPFPGNVRELQNIIERASVLARGQQVTLADLPPQVIAAAQTASHAGADEPAGAPLRLGGHDADQPWTPMPLEDALREPERQILLRALKANLWNRQKTADQLGINRTTLYKKLKAHGLDEDTTRAAG